MTKSPIVLQKDVRSDFPGAIETIYTADAFYVSAGGRWKKVEVTGETRVRQFVDLLARSPFRDCEADGVDTVEGVDAAVYRYTQRPAEQAVNMRVWIGRDGLPYKWASGPVTSTMRYHGVAVPRL